MQNYLLIADKKIIKISLNNKTLDEALIKLIKLTTKQHH